MTNEFAIAVLSKLVYASDSPDCIEAVAMAQAALRSPGAGAMREASLIAAKQAIDWINERGPQMHDDDEYDLTQRILDALPAPEVPDRTRFLHALNEWHEGYGDVLWWRFPIVEPPYLGSPLDTDWRDGYYTHWTEFAVPEESSWPK